MISGKNSTALLVAAILLSNAYPADAGPGCPFLTPVAPLSVKDSVPDGRALVSLAWVARDFSVTIRSVDTSESCVFELDKFASGSKNARTGLCSFIPGKYRFSYQYRHKPGSHVSTAWSDTVIDLKAGIWYITRFDQTSINHGGQSVMRLVRAKTWRLELVPAAKNIVVKHALGERPGIRTIVLVGIVLVTLFFGGLVVYTR